MADVTARARVQITIEFDVGSQYGKGWTIDQITNDVSIAAENTIAEMIRVSHSKAVMIGTPAVLAIITRPQ